MLKTLKRPPIRIGPGDDGRPMLLGDFDRATVQEGRWRGQWQEDVITPSRRYTTPHLPGFKLKLKRVFDAARMGRGK